MKNYPASTDSTLKTNRPNRFDLDETGPQVALVGAGPGDPGLLTLRGRELLDQADVVVYDYLSNPALLQFAPSAEHLYVGKKAASHSMTQDQINALLVDRARAGQRVVRLKGGDPFVFGRGGEECEALAGAGIDFEVVPGITASIGGLAYAGIPVTHRDFNSSFTLITGHEKEQEYQEAEARERQSADPAYQKAAAGSDVDWSAVARLPCIAFYMGVKALPRICSKLIEHGMSPGTPAATVQWASMPRQRTVVATVGTLVEAVKAAGVSSPAITVVGRVVDMREVANWFEKKPLLGKTVLVTRTRQQSSELSTRLTRHGAIVIEAPTIEIAPPSDHADIDALLTRCATGARRFDWAVFTSPNGASATREALDRLGLDVRALGDVRVAAVGESTARAVRQHLALHVDLVPDRAIADALAGELSARGQVAGQRFLLLRADIARPALVTALRAGGAVEVEDVSVYETRPVAALPPEVTQALEHGRVDWITFTSSSTARNLFALLGPGAAHSIAQCKTAAIGPVTAQTLVELGVTPTVVAESSDVPALVAAMRRTDQA